MEEATTLDVYIKIVSFVVPLLVALFSYLVVNQFGLKERTKILEVELAHNADKDREDKDNYSKIWGDMKSEIDQLRRDVQELTNAVGILTERLPTKR